jgi:hypothetical protein
MSARPRLPEVARLDPQESRPHVIWCGVPAADVGRPRRWRH